MVEKGWVLPMPESCGHSLAGDSTGGLNVATSRRYNRGDIYRGAKNEVTAWTTLVAGDGTRQLYDDGSPASGSGSIISDEDYRGAERVIECGLLPAVSLLGLPANILNVMVFHRQGLRDKMNLCLFTLALVDFMYLLCMFLSTFYCPAALLSPDPLWEQTLKWQIRKHVINFVYAFWYSSGTITAIISTERCLCVTLPLRSASLFTTRTMACMLVGAIALINLLCLTYALKHTVGWQEDADGNDTALFLRHKVHFQVITDTVLPGVSFLTFFVVVVVTVVTVRKLRTALAWRQNSSSASSTRDKQQMTLVRMLIAVSCVYIACNTPKLSLAIVRFLVREFSTSGRYRNLFFVTHRAGHVLLMINSSVNVFIYHRQSSRWV
ncbi:uncharacterized protein LOC143301065 [Babylonia areolata]|uniref:uncharacterized protein LOC143301065 n=1 Tax=Babylonia areolata TaxID=304850 RepID=UPI003FD21340